MRALDSFGLALAGFFVGEKIEMEILDFVCFVLPCALGGLFLGLILGRK